ncbi:MAG: peptide-methionine (S)-S-oxide reductase MsrA [Gammaproteobacteria bacterium]|nr:peptide-methionine (S)-S-oxide reductase MsrA [Gammaproteobacteria bacterium]
MPTRENAISDRKEPLDFSTQHFVSGRRIAEPMPEHLARAVFGLGCFWGAERLFWQLPGVYSTAAGYAGGLTSNPSYADVCSGLTGHTEVVLVYYNPAEISYQQLLATFWESHDPTQGMRQGNDRGTQYRSAIYTTTAPQLTDAKSSSVQFQSALSEKNFPAITTEIRALEEFFYAEDYHQQYLAKNPGGYCGLAGTGACYQQTPSAGQL